ncbi:MAG: hypothetical protein IT340_19780 [Chloroflexi bacterium]|nr:hypothetical protein [Chloroflexota bacterium]
MAKTPSPDEAGPASSTLAPWLLRLFHREYHPESEVQRRHRQMIELIWTRSGMGERYFLAMQPKGVTFGAFTRQVTELVCRGAQAGWITIHLPPAPTFDDDAYRMDIHDPERFVAELEALFDEQAQAQARRRNRS